MLISDFATAIYYIPCSANHHQVQKVLQYLTLKCIAREHATKKINISPSKTRSYRKTKQWHVAQNLKAVFVLMNHGFGKSLWELEIRNYDLIKQERLKMFSNKMPLFFQCSILKM